MQYHFLGDNMMKKTIKVIILVLIITFFVWVISHKKSNKAFYVFGSHVSVVVSDSMENTIKTNDFIVYKKTDEYKIGDIIVFSYNNKLIVHRIINKNENGYITKGDNNTDDDFDTFGYIKESQVMGKVTRSFRLFGLGKWLVN